MVYLNFFGYLIKVRLMSLHRGKCFSMSVTVKMGNAKNEFEWYSDLGDLKKLTEINSLVGILKVFKNLGFP